MRKIVLAAALSLAAYPALAQQSAPTDAQLVQAQVESLTAALRLDEGLLARLRADHAKREADLAAWFKDWFAEPKAEDAPAAK